MKKGKKGWYKVGGRGDNNFSYVPKKLIEELKKFAHGAGICYQPYIRRQLLCAPRKT
jgi:hypothetical protein